MTKEPELDPYFVGVQVSGHKFSADEPLVGGLGSFASLTSLIFS
jgi:hypothetical protein